MDPKLVLVLVVGVIAMTIGGSEAITCYECNSDIKNNCGDTFSSEGIQTCTGRTCFKSKGTLSGESIVLRYCMNIEYTSAQCFEESLEGYTATVCVCLSDYCNDGQTVKPTHYKILLAVAMATPMAISWMNQF